MADSVFYHSERLKLKATTKQEIAREVTRTLRNAGIDVVDGLDPDEALGRLPLSYFLLYGWSEEIVVGSLADRSVDYLQKATAARYPQRYFLCHDEARYASGMADSDAYISHIVAKVRPSSGCVARLSIFYQEPRKGGMVVRAGDVVYNPMNGSLRYEREEDSRHEIEPEIYEPDNHAKRELRFVLNGVSSQRNGRHCVYSNYTETSNVLGTDEAFDLNEMVRKAVKFDIETTGAVIVSDYNGFLIQVPQLPSSEFTRPLLERMTFDVDSIDEDRYYKPDIGVEYAVDALGEEELQEAITVLRADLDEQISEHPTSRRSRYGWNNINTSYAMVMKPAPKGERRPIGHIVVGVSDGIHYEYCEFAVARTSINFEITDIYLRTSKGGAVAFRRCNGMTMSGIKEMIGDPRILKSSLEHARNIRNRYAASAAIASQEDAGSVAIPASTLRSIASLKFGADFVEWSYRMGYVTLADEICGVINSRRAWDRVTSMQDIIPGFVEDSKSLFTCLGMPKAWGKAAFELCVKAQGNDFTRSDIHDAALSLQIAWALESALTDGKPSEASVPARASEYAAIWREHLSELGLTSGRRTVTREQWLFMAYENDPIGMAEAMRSYHRMIKKAAKLGLDDNASRTYLVETFQAYCQLRAIGENPEAHGVLYEYGLPEEDLGEALAMVERRCGAAQDVLAGYQAILNEKEHDLHESKYDEHRKSMYWLECSDPEVSKDYVFKLPTKLYGDDDPLSLQSEGRMQSNCVFGSYLTKLANGEYTIVLMRKRNNPNASFVTIGINKSMTIDQTYLAYNHPIKAEHGQAIKAWLSKVISRGKGALKMSGHPGGWNE